MNNITSNSLKILFCIGLLMALFSTLEPWIDETFREEKIDIESDDILCTPYTPRPRGVSGILYCDCGDNEYQEPGKCEDKYK